MSDWLWESSLNSPVYLSQSSLISLHHCPLFCSGNLRQNTSQSPGLHSAIPWAFSMLYYHLISLFFCHSSPLYYLFSYLMKDGENPPKQNDFDTCDVYGYGWPHMIFLFNRAFCLFCNFFFFFWTSEDTAISFGRNEGRRNSSPPRLSALVLCDPGHFGGLDKIFIPLIPKLTQWCVKNQAMFHSTDHLMGSLL